MLQFAVVVALLVSSGAADVPVALEVPISEAARQAVHEEDFRQAVKGMADSVSQVTLSSMGVDDSHWHNVTTKAGRTADVYVPACASKDSSIIIVPHGLGMTPDIQKKLDRYTEKAEEECTVVVYPFGALPAEHFPGGGFSWNAGGCCPGANVHHVDDVAFLEQMIDLVADRFQVDGQSVFVSGISNGAMMANRFACESSRVKGLIAVAGPLSNGTGIESFKCDRTVPSLYFHGTRDPLIPLGGCNKTWSSYGHICPILAGFPGYPHEMPKVLPYISFLRTRNGINEDATGTVNYQKKTTTCTSWGQAVHNVTFCEVGGLGHMWPGAKGLVKGSCVIPWYHCNFDVDATEQAWSFMRAIKTMTRKPNTIVV